MKDDKPPTPAELYIKAWRMRFYSLFPTEFSFLLQMFVAKYDCRWEKGMLVDSDDSCTSTEDLQLTEAGYQSLRNAGDGRLPMSWPDPRPAHSPLRCIPDDIDESWLSEISSFCWALDKIDSKLYTKLVTAYWAMSGYGVQYADGYRDRSIQNLAETKKLIIDLKVKERLAFIRKERQEKLNGKYVPAPSVHKGGHVRLCTGSDIATVKRLLKIGRNNGCEVDPPLSGSRFWTNADIHVID